MKRMKRMKCMKSAAPQKTHEIHEIRWSPQAKRRISCNTRRPTHEMHEIRPPAKTHETHETHEIHEIRMTPKIQQERFCTHFMKTKSTHILHDEAFLANLITLFYAAHPIDDEWL